MTFAADLLQGIGPALRARAGSLLTDLVEALTSESERARALVQPTGRYGHAAAFDAAATPDPRWLGAATGTTIPAGMTLDQQREYLATRAAFRRGTVGAMKAAVRALLDGDTRRVDIIERIDGDPYRFGIRVWASEIPGGDTGKNRDDLVEAAMTEKPLGLLGIADDDVEIVDHDATFGHFAATHTFGGVKTKFSTMSGIYTHVPEEGTPD